MVFGASTDSEHSHKAWIERDFGGSLPSPLLHDMKREAADAYGMLLRGHRAAGYVHRRPRGHAGIRGGTPQQHRPEHRGDAWRPQALQTGELCPVDWRPGQATLS